RLSPIVASELLRGVSGHGARSVIRLVRGLIPVEPPSWRSCWLETGRLLSRVFPDHEALGLAQLQNDLLLALTARQTGTLFVTDRGRVVAELRRPSVEGYQSPAEQALGRLVAAGVLTIGLPQDPASYHRTGVRIARASQALLDAERADR